MMLTITLIAILVAALCVLWALKRQDELSDLKEELDKYSSHLDERANRIAADEQTLLSELDDLRRARAMFVDIEESPSGDGGANPQ